MLRCTVEIVPFGVEKEKYPIYKFFIGNVKTYEGFADYWVFLNKDPRKKKYRRPPEFFVNKHKRSDGALVLLRKIFNAVVKAEKQNAQKEK